MTTPLPVDFQEQDLSALGGVEGTLVVFADGDKKLGSAAAHVDSLAGGALGRLTAEDGYSPSAKKPRNFAYPNGMAAKSVILASLGTDPDREAARRCGGTIAAGGDAGLRLPTKELTSKPILDDGS